MIGEKDITLFLHRKASAVLVLVVAAILSWLTFLKGDVVSLGSPLGIGLIPARDWPGSAMSSLIASWICTVAMGMLILYINRAFNMLRSLTSLVAAMFFAMQMSMPSVTDRFYGGDLLGILTLVCIVLLFSSYGDGTSQRRVFLIFFLLSLAAFTDLSYLPYLPVFLAGCVQMRIFNLRTFLAAGMGALCPAWMLFGLGILRPDQLHLPDIVLAWDMFRSPEVIHALVTSGFTIVCAIVFSVANLLKILSYNSRVRAYNGFLTLLFGVTGVCMVLNFNNFAFYIPLLNCSTAYQIAHFFTYRRTRRSYIAIMALIGVYFGFYFWYMS